MILLFRPFKATNSLLLAEALINLSLNTLLDGLQFTETNKFVGIEERYEAIHHLGYVLQQNNQQYFGKKSVKRPGNLMGIKWNYKL